MEIRTRRWTRSPRGCVLGVATGLAEWRGLPINLTRLLVLLLICSTSFVPGVIIYLVVALLLPEQTSDDVIRESYHSSSYSRREKEDEEQMEWLAFMIKKAGGMDKLMEAMQKMESKL